MLTASNNWLFTPELSAALSQTLLHSLWQALLAAALAAFILMLTRRSTSSLRYNLLLSVFFLFLVTSAATFYTVFQRVSAPAMEGAAENASISAINHRATVSAGGEGWIHMVYMFLIQYSSLLVNIWLLVLTFKLVKMSVDMYTTQRMKHHRTSSNLMWQGRVWMLANRMGIKKQVILLESAIARVPLTIGTLKPVILVPVGFFTGLSVHEVEAVLLHELAHIKRHDYFVNLLQCFSEIVFFFNPALLWMSSLLRREREYCCDDLAVAGIADKKNYIKALVASGEFHSYATAMGFAAIKGHLIRRVKRIVSNDNGRAGLPEKSALVLGACTVVLMLVALKPATGEGPASAQSNPASQQVAMGPVFTFKDQAVSGRVLKDRQKAIYDTVPKPPVPPAAPATLPVPGTPAAPAAPAAPAIPEVPPVPPIPSDLHIEISELKNDAKDEAERVRIIVKKINTDSLHRAVMKEFRIDKAANDSAMAKLHRELMKASRGMKLAQKEIEKNKIKILLSKDSIVNIHREHFEMDRLFNLKNMDSLLSRELARLPDLHFRMRKIHVKPDMYIDIPEIYYSHPTEKIRKTERKRKTKVEEK